MRTIMAFIVTLTLILPWAAKAQQKADTAPPAVIQRMVKVTYDVPEDRAGRKGATLDVAGWLVDDDTVLTMWFPKGSKLRVDGRPATLVRESESARLTLLKAAVGRRVGPVPLSDATSSALIGLDEYEGRMVMAFFKLVAMDRQFVYVPQKSELTTGAGIFTPDAKLVTIVVAFVEIAGDGELSAAVLPVTLRQFLGR